MDCNSGGAGDGGARRWWLSLDGQPGRTVLWLLHRSVHPNTKVVAEIDGRRRTVCCARCAISEAYQEKKPLRLIAATDYVSGKDIDPKQAYFVEGSHRVLCAHNEAMVDESKHVQPMTYDRCFPGTYAFAHREDAEAFERENGGTVLRLDKLLQGVSGQ